MPGRSLSDNKYFCRSRGSAIYLQDATHDLTMTTQNVDKMYRKNYIYHYAITLDVCHLFFVVSFVDTSYLTDNVWSCTYLQEKNITYAEAAIGKSFLFWITGDEVEEWLTMNCLKILY